MPEIRLQMFVVSNSNAQTLNVKVKLNVMKEITKTFENTNLNMKNNTQKNRNTLSRVKNLKRQLMTKDFFWRLKLHVGR